MDENIKGDLSVNACEKSGMSDDDAPGSVQVDEEKSSVAGEKAPPASNLCSGSSLIQGEESVGKTDDSPPVDKSSGEADKGRKSSSGKRKIKVDWTPELHRKFVQAVEQLGVDKAVPSKILELMGIDCLTRHNVASHLQKYRSHRKHMLAREAEAATWSQRRQTRGATVGRAGKGDVNSWTVSTTGFPSVTPMPHIRPLHVWGHPSADQSLAYMWPGHVGSSHSSPAWAPAYHPHPQPPPGDPYFWYHHPQDVPAPGMPYFPSHFPPTRFTTTPVSGLPSTSMYRVAPSMGASMAPHGQPLPQPSFDSYPSKESIDAVIGEVLSRPWLPLPLGLKPPSIDSVMVELQRQGISKVPPACVL